jgi:hypothetical protein
VLGGGVLGGGVLGGGVLGGGVLGGGVLGGRVEYGEAGLIGRPVAHQLKEPARRGRGHQNLDGGPLSMNTRQAALATSATRSGGVCRGISG